MAQQPEGFVPTPAGFVPDGFEPDAPAPTSPSMNFAMVNGQRVPVDEGLGAAADEFVQNANPIPGLAGIAKVVAPAAAVFGGGFNAATAPLIQRGADEAGRMYHGIMDAQNQVKAGADEAWAKGDYPTALRKYADWLLPLNGPIADKEADNLAAGRTARGVGGLAGLATGMLAPEAIGAARNALPSGGLKVFPSLLSRTTNPVEASAVALGEREGVAMDAGTITGSPAVRNAQKRLEGTIGGAAPTQAFQAAKDAGLTRTGRTLADQVNPTPSTPESAGQALRTGTQDSLRALDRTVDQHYGRLRTIEAANPGLMDVNVAGAKAQFRPLYERLKRESELVPLQGGKAKALTALDRLMNGPDTAPLTDVDAALSDLKDLARSDMPELRTKGQGAAAAAVGPLEAQVQAAVQKGGPDAIDALRRGRQAYREKVAVADVLDALHSEPVKTYGQAVARQDTAIGQLRRLQQIAPQAMPQVARAWLDDALGTATQEGKFAHTDKLYADWQRLGDETKQTLFGARMTKDLDDFFLLAKKLGENPNPSGTANVLGFNATQALAYLPTKVMTKMLYSPQRGFDS